MFHVLLNLILTVLISLIVTPVIKTISFAIGAVDEPNKRRMNKTPMPTMGGVAIYLSSFLSAFLLQPINTEFLIPLFVASTIIVITGIIDDIKEIKPLLKVLGILSAALIVYFVADMNIHVIYIPYFGNWYLGWLSFPITILWILGITNSINLIDGLDGLASGISIIALTTLGILGYFFLGTSSLSAVIFIFTIVAAIIGFWFFNFFPASIYLGDTGALFLGFMISVVSLEGLKNATFISVIIPIIILGVPITDTFSAIIRRIVNKKPISEADKNHIHHRLMSLGMTHRQTVLSLYLVAIIFATIALIVPISSSISTLLLIITLLIGLEFFIEMIGLISEDHKPLIKLIKYFTEKTNRNR